MFEHHKFYDLSFQNDYDSLVLPHTKNTKLSEDLMNYKQQWQKTIFSLLLIWTFIFNVLPIKAQDIPPTEELSLGSSVFVFRGSSKSKQKKYVAREIARPKRTNTQRIASSKRLRTQYNTLAKVVTRRSRVTPIAEEKLDVARKTPQEASIALTGAGQYYLDKENYDKSIYFYRGANDIDGKNQDAILGLSDALASKGDELLENDKADEAQKFYQESIKFNDKNSSAYAGLGEVYDILDKNAQAIASYEKALELDKDLTETYTPLGILYYHQGEIAKADELLSKALKVNKDSAETQYFLGLIRAKQNRLTDALAAFNESVKLDPTSAEAHYALGETYEELSQENDAIAQFTEAVKLNPKYAEAWFALGVAQYNEGNYGDAATAYQNVIKLQNTNGEAHANLGDTYRLLKDFGKSEGEYRLATYFIKNDAELYSKFGYVLGAQRKWESSIAALKSANSLSPDVVDYTNLGWAYYNWAQDDIKAGRAADGKAKTQLAKEALQKAVGLNQNFAPAFLNLGVALNDLGEYKDSITALTRAVALRKDWIFAINELGLAFRGTNDYDNAIKQFQKVVEIDPKFDRGFYNLGESQVRGGRINDAKETLKKLKALRSIYASSLEVMLLGAKKK